MEKKYCINIQRLACSFVLGMDMKKVFIYLLIAGAISSCSNKKDMTPVEMKEGASNIEHRVNKLDSKIDSLANTIK